VVKNYPDYYNALLGSQKKLMDELPGPMSSFAQLHKESIKEDVLTTKTKELIALGI